MERNNWVTHHSREIYDNPWITLTEHDVTNPGGGKSLYGKVHFKNKAIGIIPLDEEEYTWIVGQWRYPLGAYSWEIPMGGGPLGEDRVASAGRELKEETGLTARRWTELIKIHTSNSVTDEVGYCYLAQELSLGEPEFEETEDIDIWRLPLREAVAMCEDNRITDSLSVAGLLRLARKLHL